MTHRSGKCTQLGGGFPNPWCQAPPSSPSCVPMGSGSSRNIPRAISMCNIHVQYSMWNIPCGIFHVQYSMYTVPRAIFHVHCSMCHIPHVVFHIQYPHAVFHVQYSMCNIPRAIHHVQYSMCNIPRAGTPSMGIPWSSSGLSLVQFLPDRQEQAVGEAWGRCPV